MRPWVLVVAAVVVVAVVIVVTNSGGGKPGDTGKSSSGANGGHRGTTVSDVPLSLTSTSPAAGATNVPSDSTISLTFSSPVDLGSVHPTVTPSVAGTWVQASKDTLAYDLSDPLVPYATETVTVPGGSKGIRSTDGKTLASTTNFTFTVVAGDMLRVQQLLAQLDFLPLSFVPSVGTPAGKDLATDQPGSFAWRWSTLPAVLTSQWIPGEENMISKAAVEAFETQNNLTVDGDPGPSVWDALLADVEANKVDATPYVYVLVNKVQPENLTLYQNGAVTLANILVNTGAQGADTTDGTYAVFEHVRFSDMKGTNPDGSTYNDPNVPYASYFNGGDALHGFIRASYGFPQSNGCVEMAYVNAALVWPLTPIGTLVTVEGPASPPLPTPPTTTTTTPPATTPTTAPPTPTAPTVGPG
jgi:hypothetical protein